MPIFRLVVASRETGKTDVIEVDAKSEVQARMMAYERGLVVASVTKLGRSWGLLIAIISILAITVLGAAILYSALRDARQAMAASKASEPHRLEFEYDEVRDFSSVCLYLNFQSDKSRRQSTEEELTLTFRLYVKGKLQEGDVAVVDHVAYQAEWRFANGLPRELPMELLWLVDGKRDFRFTPDSPHFNGVFGAVSVVDLKRIASSQSAVFTADNLFSTFILNEDDRTGLQTFCSYLSSPVPERPRVAPKAPYHPGN